MKAINDRKSGFLRLFRLIHDHVSWKVDKGLCKLEVYRVYVFGFHCVFIGLEKMYALTTIGEFLDNFKSNPSKEASLLFLVK